jgi:hypothetical protein
MTTLCLLLNTIIYFLETVKAYDHLTRKKDKGRDAQTSQPFKH